MQAIKLCAMCNYQGRHIIGVVHLVKVSDKKEVFDGSPLPAVTRRVKGLVSYLAVFCVPCRRWQAAGAPFRRWAGRSAWNTPELPDTTSWGYARCGCLCCASPSLTRDALLPRWTPDTPTGSVRLPTPPTGCTRWPAQRIASMYPTSNFVEQSNSL